MPEGMVAGSVAAGITSAADSGLQDEVSASPSRVTSRMPLPFAAGAAGGKLLADSPAADAPTGNQTKIATSTITSSNNALISSAPAVVARAPMAGRGSVSFSSRFPEISAGGAEASCPLAQGFARFILEQGKQVILRSADLLKLGHSFYSEGVWHN
jgi:hypothetical protein